MADVPHLPTPGRRRKEILRSLSLVDFFDLDAAITCTLALDPAVTAVRVGDFLPSPGNSDFRGTRK